VRRQIEPFMQPPAAHPTTLAIADPPGGDLP